MTEFVVISRAEMERWADVLVQAAIERLVPQQQLDSARAGFFARDTRGRAWSFGLKTRQWHRKEGKDWIADTPPEQLSIARDTLDQLKVIEVPRASQGAFAPRADSPQTLAPGEPVNMEADDARARGDSHRGKGEFDLAIQQYDLALQLNPNCALIYNNRGAAYFEKGNFQQAVRDYNRAIELVPVFPGALVNRGLVYRKNGELDRALQDFNRAIELNPSDRDAYQERDHLYFAKGELFKKHDQDPVWREPSVIEASQQLATGGYTIGGLALSPDGRYVLMGAGDNMLRLWDVKSGRELRRIYELGRSEGSTLPCHMAFSASGRHAVVAYESGAVRVLKGDNLQEVHRLQVAGGVSSIAFLPDERHAWSGGPDNAVCLWDLARGVEVLRVRDGSEPQVALASDGSCLAVYWKVNGELRLYDARNGHELRRFDWSKLTIGRRSVGSLALSSDKRRILLNATRRLLVVDTQSGELLLNFSHPPQVGIVNARFTPDGRRILGGSVGFKPPDQDMETFLRRGGEHPTANKLHVWDAASGRELLRGVGHTHAVDSISMSADGRRVLTGSAYGGVARLWHLP